MALLSKLRRLQSPAHHSSSAPSRRLWRQSSGHRGGFGHLTACSCGTRSLKEALNQSRCQLSLLKLSSPFVLGTPFTPLKHLVTTAAACSEQKEGIPSNREKRSLPASGVPGMFAWKTPSEEKFVTLSEPRHL